MLWVRYPIERTRDGYCATSPVAKHTSQTDIRPSFGLIVRPNTDYYHLQSRLIPGSTHVPTTALANSYSIIAAPTVNLKTSSFRPL